MISYRESFERATSKLESKPADAVWSTDYHSGRDLVDYLARSGKNGEYGENFEELSDPLALTIPGVLERTSAAVLATARELGITVTPDVRPGKAPLFALSGAFATGGLVDIRGVVLALLSASQSPSEEFSYAVKRVVSSGTHTGSVSRVFAAAARKANA